MKYNFFHRLIMKNIQKDIFKNLTIFVKMLIGNYCVKKLKDAYLQHLVFLF